MSFKYTFLLFLAAYLLFSESCNTDDYDADLPETQPEQKVGASPLKCSYSIYLENSGSLNGYLQAFGDSSFKDNVNHLITTINSLPEKQSLNLYDVNTKIIPVARNADAKQIGDYIEHLDSQTFRKRSVANGGDQTKSDLSDIIKNILDSMGNNEVSLLISDCIFSPGKGLNALNFLSSEGSKVKVYVDEKLKRIPLSTLVLQFDSDFNGIYYDQNNTKKSGKFKQRPYYIVCFGKEGALRNLLYHVQEQYKFKGYRNFLFLTNTKSYNVSPCIVSSSTYYEYDPENPMVLTISEEDRSDPKFRIKLAVDFLYLPVNDAYINDPNNYILSKGYRIESITPTDRKGLSHQLILVSDKPQTGKIEVSLKRQLLTWIMASNIDTDSNLPAEALAGKTFGIGYMLRGIYEAYEQYINTPNYFTFSISVKE